MCHAPTTAKTPEWMKVGLPYSAKQGKATRKFQDWECSGCGTKCTARFENSPSRCEPCFLESLKARKWGNLTVVGPLTPGSKTKVNGKIISRTRATVLCVCDCGNERNVTIEMLLAGQAEKCSKCARRKKSKLRDANVEKLSGKTFGWLQYVGEIPSADWPTKRHASRFLCLGCNQEHVLRIDGVIVGNVKACPRCCKKENARLKVDLPCDARKKAAEAMLATDHLRMGDSSWQSCVEYFLPLVTPTVGRLVESMSPARYAAYLSRVRGTELAERLIRKTLKRAVFYRGERKTLANGPINYREHFFCEKEHLHAHIESQFAIPGNEWMSWANHDLAGWNVDHWFPVAEAVSLGLEKYVNHWKNLMPLRASVNMSKRHKVLPAARERFMLIVREVEEGRDDLVSPFVDLTESAIKKALKARTQGSASIRKPVRKAG